MVLGIFCDSIPGCVSAYEMDGVHGNPPFFERVIDAAIVAKHGLVHLLLNAQS